MLKIIKNKFKNNLVSPCLLYFLYNHLECPMERSHIYKHISLWNGYLLLPISLLAKI